MGMRALEEMGAKRKQRGSFGTAHRIVYARGKAGSHGEEGTTAEPQARSDLG